MPKLPDANDLNRVGYDAVRRFVPIPDVNIEGAYNRLAAGISGLGDGLAKFARKQEEAYQKSERFKTKVALARSEQDFANRTKSLDPKDPAYVEKKKTARKEVFGPVLNSVTNPENKMAFDSQTERDYIAISKQAEADRLAALKESTKQDLLFYKADLEKRIEDGQFIGNAADDIRTMLDDSPDLDDQEKSQLASNLVRSVSQKSLQSTAKSYFNSGVALLPELRNAISQTEADPAAPGWLGGFLSRTATIESFGGVRNEDPDNMDFVGPYKLDADAMRSAGLKPEDRIDLNASTKGAARIAVANYGELRSKLGRDPTMGELYIAHRYGANKAIALLQNPEAAAVDVVGEEAVARSGGWGMMTAGQLASIMDLRYDNGDLSDDPDEIRDILSTDPSFAALDTKEIDEIARSSAGLARNRDLSDSSSVDERRKSIFRQFAELDETGDLNQDWVNAQSQTGLLSPQEIRLFSNTVANRNKRIADDELEVASVVRRINLATSGDELSDARAALDEAYADGRISNQTKARLLTGLKARSSSVEAKNDASARGETMIARMVRSRDYSSGNALEDEMTEMNGRIAFQSWLNKNAKATDADIISEAQKIAKSTAMERVENARNTLELPSGLSGVNRRALTRDQIYKYAASLKGRGSRAAQSAEYLRDVALLKKWLEIIDIQEMVA